jgi:hypothetical protein
MFPGLDLTPRIHSRPVSAPAWTLKAAWISYPSEDASCAMVGIFTTIEFGGLLAWHTSKRSVLR